MRKENQSFRYELAWVDEQHHTVSFHDHSGYKAYFFETHDELIRYVHHLVIRGYGLL